MSHSEQEKFVIKLTAFADSKGWQMAGIVHDKKTGETHSIGVGENSLESIGLLELAKATMLQDGIKSPISRGSGAEQ